MMLYQKGHVVQNQYSEGRKSVEHPQTPGYSAPANPRLYIKSV